MNLALHGPICSGKSTVAHLLRDLHGYSIVTLAKPIYVAAELSREFIGGTNLFPVDLQDFISALTDADNEAIYHDWLGLMSKHTEVLLSGKKPRAFLQDFGMMMRSYDEGVFIRRAIEDAEYDRSVCDDLRMNDEAWALRDAGWLLVKVDLPEEKRLERVERLYPEQKKLLGHQTECDLADWQSWDGVICTDCPESELPGRVQVLLDGLS